MSPAAQPLGAEAPAASSLIAAPTSATARSAATGPTLVQLHYSASSRPRDAAPGPNFRPSTLAKRLSYRNKIVTFSSSWPRTSLRRAPSSLPTDMLPENTPPSGATRDFLTKTMSRLHASLIFINGRPALVDHASTHGTYVSRVHAAQSIDEVWIARVPYAAHARLQPEQPFFLEDGDLVTLGKDVIRDDKLFQAVRAFVKVTPAQADATGSAAVSEPKRTASSLRGGLDTNDASASSAAAPFKNPTRRYGLDSIGASDDEGHGAETSNDTTVDRSTEEKAVSDASDSFVREARGLLLRRSPMQRDDVVDMDDQSRAEAGDAASESRAPSSKTARVERSDAAPAPRLKSEPLSDSTESLTGLAGRLGAVKSEKALLADGNPADSKATSSAVRAVRAAPRPSIANLSGYAAQRVVPSRTAAATGGDDTGDDPAEADALPNDDGHAQTDAWSEAERRLSRLNAALSLYYPPKRADTAAEAELDEDLEDEDLELEELDEELESGELDEELEQDDVDENDDYDAHALDDDDLCAAEAEHPSLAGLHSEHSEDDDDSESASVAPSDALDENADEVEEEGLSAVAEGEEDNLSAVSEEDEEAVESDIEASQPSDSDEDLAAAEEDDLWLHRPRVRYSPCECFDCRVIAGLEEDEADSDSVSEASEASCSCSSCVEARIGSDDDEEDEDEQFDEDAADEPATPESSNMDAMAAAVDADDYDGQGIWVPMKRINGRLYFVSDGEESDTDAIDTEQVPTAEEPVLDAPLLAATQSLSEAGDTGTSAVAGVKRSLDDMQREEETNSLRPSDNAELAPQLADSPAAAHDVAARPSKRARRLATARTFAAGVAAGALGTFLGLARLGRAYE